MPDFLVDFKDFEELTTGILIEGKRLRFKVRGNSMRPFIWEGDLVELQKIHPDQYKRGDVAFCRLPGGRLVVHRVVKTGSQSLVVQGDSLSYNDGEIPHSDVLGKVDAIYRNDRLIRFDSLWMIWLVQLWLFIAPLRHLLLRAKSRLNYLAKIHKPTELHNRP